MIPSAVAQLARENLFDYLRTTYALSDAALEQDLFDFLRGKDGLFRGPYLSVKLPFRKALAGQTIPLDVAPDFEPYQHQLRAFERLYSRGSHQPQHTLVTTGTGSGKTECFLYPILDHCLRERQAGKPGIKAILLYPMNALATDQARRLAKTLWSDPRLKGKVTAGIFVGGKGRYAVADDDHLVDKREALRQSPPDILLTNYKMLDFLLMRPDDRELWRNNGPETLRYLVLDELHTYDGAQGSDVACLIRRLKGRLGMEAGGLCCVGTSATIGDGDPASKQELAEFARQIFDEEFLSDSIITEDRVSIREALGRSKTISTHPNAEDLDSLRPSEGIGLKQWQKTQRGLWLGPEGEGLSAVELSGNLKEHEFLHLLLRCLEGGSREYAGLLEKLSKKESWFAELSPEGQARALDSFVGLISEARSETPPDKDGNQRVIPFLSVQCQLWLREVHGLLRAVEAGTRFTWKSELGGSAAGSAPAERWLPLVRCRDCGGAGWAAVQRESEERLRDDSEEKEIGRAWLDRRSEARYLAFGHGTSKIADGEEHPEYLCPSCLRLSTKAECDCEAGHTPPGIPVRVCRELTNDPVPRFKPVCPDCGEEDSLIYLASRAASLLSVGISHLFQTGYNDDKKVLAFTDSVQDASHRAGFFGARTYRFNLRTMIQTLLDDNGGRLPLVDCGEKLLNFVVEREGLKKAVPVLVPHDLRDHPDYEGFIGSGGKKFPSGMRHWLANRLTLETQFEFGLKVRQGRSLEKTGCSITEVNTKALEKATSDLTMIAQEDGFLGLLGDEVKQDDMRYFLLGLVNRLRLRGGVRHPWMKAYVQSTGGRYHLTKHRQPFMTAFGRDSVLPRFLLMKHPDGGKRHAFDAVRSRGSLPSWYKDWASRALGLDLGNQQVDDLYRNALGQLVAAEIFFEDDAETGHRKVWGVDPACLDLVGEVRELTCSACKGALRVPTEGAEGWEGKPCTQYRCSGQWGPAQPSPEDFYTRIFRSGRIARVFSDEHTGLLERSKREDLEKRFKEGTDPDAPNLLVCTPTLEMGIDIGDLSAALLCTVPPTTTMYLQRIGRAGRSNGNALCLTMATARPHDLYFHSEPSLMLEGAVNPPGCFLDAPEMLKRQVVAHGMDAWAKEDTEAKVIPRQTTAVLNDLGGTFFPGRFLDYYEVHKTDLLDSFLDRFGKGQLGDENREDLKRYALSDWVRLEFLKAFDEVGIERKNLKNLQEKARKRLREVEEHPERYDDAEHEKSEIEHTRKMLGKIHEELGRKYPLNVLTDAGVLPNYAFPEPGVVLNSVVHHQEGNTRRYESYEYMRPSSSAIRELAPFNTFYAEGKRVQIDEIDLGTSAAPLRESWRLCGECNHIERLLEESEPDATCPLCGDTAWSDSGQVRTMVHFKRSKSIEDRLEVAIADDGEDRKREYYQTEDLISVERKNCEGARLIQEVPFGYEMLTDLVLREINFGPLEHLKLPVAGRKVNEMGFEVCTDCGRVKEVRGKKEIKHAATCSHRRGQQPPEEGIYLYREIESEAIRLLLPFVFLDVEVQTASIKAAIQLGLRLRYRGRAAHLQLKSMREPVQGGGHKHFLVLFDSVPGGTGYLADLWRGGDLMNMLAKTLEGLQNCPCQNRGEDGCYQCLYAYQGQQDLERTSSKIAQQILSEILDKRDNIEEGESLSDVVMDSKLESELEERFLRSLERRARKFGTWDQVIRHGEKHWEFEVSGQRWDVIPQVYLGQGAGVNIPSKPDFLLKPLTIGGDTRPIAVFCDGFKYHVCPDDEESRLGDDIRKRRSILETGEYLVWSVTWKDVEDFDVGERVQPDLPLVVDAQPPGLQVWAGFGLGKSLGLAQLPSMELLWDWLRSPDSEVWMNELRRIGFAWVVRSQTLENPSLEEYENSLQRGAADAPLPEEVDTRPESQWLARANGVGPLKVLAKLSAASLNDASPPAVQWTLRLLDGQELRKGQGYKRHWNSFLQATNLLQFAEDAFMTTTEEIDVYGGGVHATSELPESASAVAESPSAPDPWAEHCPSALERRLLEAVRIQFSLTGQLGHELDPGADRCTAEAQIAWPDARLAWMPNAASEDIAAFKADQWLVLGEEASIEDVLSAIQEAMDTKEGRT